MEAGVVSHLQAHFHDLLATYHPYREHIAPVFRYLGVGLDEAQELSILLLLASVILLTALLLVLRTVISSSTKKHTTLQPSKGRKKRLKKNSTKPNRASSPSKALEKPENNAREQKPLLQREGAEIGGEERNVTGNEKKGIPQTLQHQQTETQVEETHTQEKMKIEEKEEAEQQEVWQEKEKELSVCTHETTRGEPCQTASDETPGTRKVPSLSEETPLVEEEQPVTPLRRSSRVKATPQKFSPSAKRRVRKVD